MRLIHQRGRLIGCVAAAGWLLGVASACDGEADVPPGAAVEAASISSPVDPPADPAPTPTPPSDEESEPAAALAAEHERDGDAAAAAWANVRSAISSIERYAAHNDTYVGLTVNALRASYDAGFPSNLRFGRLTATTYCIESTVGEVTFRKRGPDAEIEQRSCPGVPEADRGTAVDLFEDDPGFSGQIGQEWARDANLICQELNGAWNAIANEVIELMIASELGDPTEGAADVDFERRFTQGAIDLWQLYETRAELVGMLRRPTEKAERVDALVGELEEEARLVRRIVKLLPEDLFEALWADQELLGAELRQALEDLSSSGAGGLAADLELDHCVDLEREVVDDPEPSEPSPSAAVMVAAAIPALEARYADNDTWEGATIEGLRRAYDAGLGHRLRLVVAAARTYCVEATLNGETAYKDGPAAEILGGSCE